MVVFLILVELLHSPDVLRCPLKFPKFAVILVESSSTTDFPQPLFSIWYKIIILCV
uniref:Uncharacterized protein n=1 Tax=uncultured bacterium contig00010 TaxID=1181502 RepID=A0A806KEY1_9BACT|nr:hypothetical protein [uncultured bacterium contig00010]